MCMRSLCRQFARPLPALGSPLLPLGIRLCACVAVACPPIRSLSYLVKRAEDRHVVEIAEKLCGHVLGGQVEMR